MLEEEDRKEIVRLSEATHTSIVAFVLSLFIPLVGLILGLKAKSEIDKSEHTKSGSAFATAAIWIGAIGTLAWAALLALVILVSVGGHGNGWGFGSRDEHRGFGSHQMMRFPHSGLTSTDPNGTTASPGMMGGYGLDQGPGSTTPNGGGTTSNG